MAGVFGDYSQLFGLFHASVIKRFVRRENPERELQLKKKKFSDTSGEEDSIFVAETASLLDLFPELIIKITISSLLIGLKKAYFPLIRSPSCYRTVCYWIVCYWTVCYWTVKKANHIQSVV